MVIEVSNLLVRESIAKINDYDQVGVGWEAVA